jgi:hypothetical protein
MSMSNQLDYLESNKSSSKLHTPSVFRNTVIPKRSANASNMTSKEPDHRVGIESNNQDPAFESETIGSHAPLAPVASEPQTKADKSIQDEAIAAMLNRGTDPKNIPKYVQHHIIAKETGNHRDLDIISQIPSTELQERISNVGE